VKQAKTWIDKAIDDKGAKFWQLRQKSLIYTKVSDKKGAIEAAKRSMQLAKEAGNDDYVAMNAKSLKEWGSM